MLNPEISTMIVKMNEKIYDKFSEDEVREATQIVYKDDADIKKQK